MTMIGKLAVENFQGGEAEEGLRRQREFLYAVLDSIEEPIVACDAQGALTLINRPARELGCTAAQPRLGSEWPDRLRLYCSDAAELPAPDNASLVLPALPGGQIGHAAADPKTPFGDGLAWLTGARALHDLSGNIIGAVASLRPVTEEKLSQETQRNLTAERNSLLMRLELHIERMPLAYILFDADCRIIDWNPAAERIFGYSKKEVLGLGPPFEKLFSSSSTPLDGTVRRTLSRDMAPYSICENLTKEGRNITCEWYNTPLIDDDGRFDGMFCLVQDITERKELEEQFRQSQKIDAIGQLAGGIAHDFNNLLTIIIGCSDMVLASFQLTDAAREVLDEIRKAGEQAASLTRQLLAFSKKQVLAPEILDLNEVVGGTEKMLRRLIGEDIQFETILRPEMDHVKIDRGQLEQVLLNLAVNARDAMPKGGKLTIKSNNVVVEEGSAQSQAGVRPGHYVMLSVTDTGEGMTDEVKRHIFEPFFTTKEPGRGTGLGLAVVHGVIKQTGGHIEVESKLGAGTSFKIYLPPVDHAARPTTGVLDSAPVPRGDETILLVEDDEVVRAVARQVLQGCGYKVLEAGCGEEALNVYAESMAPIQLLVTDVVMPGMGGGELVERLLAVCPELKVLYVSGHMVDAVARHGIAHEEVAFLSKPYMPVSLTSKVREVLDAPKSKRGTNGHVPQPETVELLSGA